jgi:hypothetical protein
MGLSEVVASLADAIATARQPLTPREAYLFFILRGMPLFRDIRRLDLWELAYKQVAPDEGTSETERLIDSLFELGEHNMYGAFDVLGTLKYYRELLTMLAESGIRVLQVDEIQGW